MARYTRAQFAELLGKKANYVSEYIKRGKLVLDENEIDDENALNALFLTKFFSKKEAPAKAQSTVKADKPNQEREDDRADEPVKSKKKKSKADELVDIELEIKRLDAEKKAKDILFIQQKIDKANGELVPTDVVKMLFAQHFKSVYAAFEDETNKLLSDIAKKAGLSNNDMAFFRGKIIASVNRAVAEGIEKSKKDLAAVVAEYSETRGKGERK